MEDSARDLPPVRHAVPCSTGCRYAEALRNYPDWIWCSHPRAKSRVWSTAHLCEWFDPSRERSTPPPAPRS